MATSYYRVCPHCGAALIAGREGWDKSGIPLPTINEQ